VEQPDPVRPEPVECPYRGDVLRAGVSDARILFEIADPVNEIADEDS
jgi:hypothetical protein